MNGRVYLTVLAAMVLAMGCSAEDTVPAVEAKEVEVAAVAAAAETNAPCGPAVLDRLAKKRSVMRQHTIACFTDHMRACAMWLAVADSEDDFDNALKHLASTREILEDHQEFFPSDQYRSLMTQVQNREKLTHKQRLKWRERRESIGWK